MSAEERIAKAIEHQNEIIEGIITGVLSFTGPKVTFRAVALNNQLIDSSDTSDHPATQAQVDNIGAASGGSLAFQNEADNVDSAIKSVTFVGVETSGTNLSTLFNDGVYHNIDDTGNDIDIVYQFDVGGGRTSTEIVWKGYLNGNNDEFTIQIYNGSGWDTLSTVAGKNGVTNDTEIHPLFASHTGTGSDLGKVFVRLQCSSQSNPSLFTDQLYIMAVNIGQTVGYLEGAVWVDTNGSNTGTVSFVDGVADKPTSLLASALTIMANVELKKLHQLKGSSITLASSFNRQIFNGEGGAIALGGQETIFCTFISQNISGIQTGVGRNFFTSCRLDGGTYTDAAMIDCSLNSTISLSDTGDYSMLNCYATKDSSEPTFDFTAVGNTELLLRGWNGPLTIDNLSSGDTVAIDGNCSGLTLTANCTGGTVVLTGNVVMASNLSSGVTLNQTGNMNIIQVSGSTDAADKLEASAETIEIGAAEAGTLSTTQMTSDLTEATDDHFNGRVIIWTSGVLTKQATAITDYSGATGLLTFTAVTEAPSASDTFIIV